MPLPTIAGVLRVSVSGALEGGGRWANTWHARNDSLVDFDLAGITAFHTIFQQFYLGPAVGGGAGLLTMMTAASQVDTFQYTPLDGSSGAYNFTGANPGSGGGACFPAECCEVVTVRTAQRGRRARGRVYLPTLSGAFWDSVGHVSTAAQLDILQQLDGVEAALEVGGAHLGVASYGRSENRAGVVTTWTPFFTEVSQFTMDGLADVQRRRKA